jgi:hypothetical protein
MDKNVYEYRQGGRRADPLAFLRRLKINSAGHINELIFDYNKANEEVGRANEATLPQAEVALAKAEEALLPISRKTFCLAEVTEDNGVNDSDALEQLFHFLTWVDDEKKA